MSIPFVLSDDGWRVSDIWAKVRNRGQGDGAAGCARQSVYA